MLWMTAALFMWQILLLKANAQPEGCEKWYSPLCGFDDSPQSLDCS